MPSSRSQSDADELRAQIAALVRRFAETSTAPAPFVPGQTPIPASGKVVGPEEIGAIVDSALDGWFTTGRFNECFERELAAFLGVKHVLTVNSGSSANLLAVSALTSPLLGDRALRPGDEVITVATGFPTTVNPLLQNGLVPVFVDAHLPTYNVDATQLERAISPKTRAIVMAHSLGNPFNLDVVMQLCKQHNLWLIEDCCDALGSRYHGKLVGTFGHIATLSFFPAHHITMGEGGAVFTNDPELKRIVESFRDWGRDCYCAPGSENTCGKRFAWKLGDLPFGYDHKYAFSHAGFNLKITDMQAALGAAQLARLPHFIERRKANFAFLRERLRTIEEFVLLPEAEADSEPSWFGFPLTLREGAGVNRPDLQRYLDQYHIGTRLVFAGNLIRQPYFHGRNYRVVGELKTSDRIMVNSLWLGVYPALDERHLEFVARKLEEFFRVD
nr:lipopolysaccharide biosynthesis protein RfbH [Usitatibacter palustris]